MKLLHKTTKVYLLFSTAMMVLAGCLLYLILTRIIREEITEKMLVNEKRIVEKLRGGEQIPSLPPILEINMLDTLRPNSSCIKNTYVFDPMEGEEELFKELRSYKTINGRTYTITQRQVILEPHDYLTSIGSALMVVMALLLAGLLWLNRRVSQKIWQPFYKNLDALKHFSLEKNHPIQLQNSNISEFQEMNAAAEKLTEKIRSDFRVLKEFTENASHEIQTPLAVIQAKLEEALQAPGLTSEQAVQLEQASAAALRLSRLNRSLLLLAKIENHQFPATGQVSVLEKIKEQTTHLEYFIKSKKIALVIQAEENVELEANPILVETLLSNLLSNAIRHNEDGGEIAIFLTKKTLVISNTGASLGLPQEQLFERFKRGEGSVGSTGLGLAIVKKICEVSGWEIQYDYVQDKHVFTLLF